MSDTNPPVAGGDTNPVFASSTLLRELFAAGKCAGNAGDFYQNLDGGHSMFQLRYCPQVTVAITTGVPPGSIVLKNQSTALVNIGASGQECNIAQSRLALIQPSQIDAMKVYGEYSHNVHTWYPAVNMIAAKWDRTMVLSPAVATCLGRSGSEQDNLRGMFMGLAAFKPEVKNHLKSLGLIMPVMEMILRRIMAGSDEEYLSPMAHPSACGPVGAIPDDATFLKIVQACQALTVEALPPFVHLQVLDETFNEIPGADYEDTLPEFGHDTPSNISRFYRGAEPVKKLIVDASGSKSLDGKPLTFHWFVERGDEMDVLITPLNDAGSKVGIVFRWSYGSRYVPDSGQASTLQAVACVVGNGTALSAPAFVNCYSFANEDRAYSAEGVLQSVTNKKTDAAGLNWVPSPYLLPVRTWDKKVCVYGANGELAAWEFITGATMTRKGATRGLVIQTPHAGSYYSGTVSLRVRGKGSAAAPTEPTFILDRNIVVKGSELDMDNLTVGTHTLQARMPIAGAILVSPEIQFHAGPPVLLRPAPPEGVYTLRTAVPTQVSWRGQSGSTGLKAADGYDIFGDVRWRVLISKDSVDNRGAEIVEVAGTAPRFFDLKGRPAGRYYVRVFAVDGLNREGASISQSQVTVV